MEDGTNKSLYTLIAVVVFGLLLSLSYYMYQDQLKGVLADVMFKTSEVTSKKLTYDGLLPTEDKYFNVTILGDNTVRIDSYDLNGGTDLVIPETINGKVVTSIGGSAFNNKGLTSLVLPNTLTRIEAGAWNDGLFVGAFSRNKLTQLTIPDSVQFIGNQAFHNAGNIEDRLTLGSGLTYIGADSMIGNNLTKVNIPLNVEKLEWHAFGYNAIKEVVFAEGSKLKTIGDIVFNDNDIERVTLPSSLTFMHHTAFAQNPLKEINIPSSLPLAGDVLTRIFDSNHLTIQAYDKSIIHYY